MDHRTSARHAVDVKAHLRIGEATVGCQVTDLSMGGAFVLGLPLPIDSHVTLYLRLPMVDNLVEAPCSVRWSSPTGSGLQFDGLRAIDVWALGRYIAAS